MLVSHENTSVRMATPMNVENLQVLKNECVPPQDMRKQLEEFLKKKHVREGLPKDKYARLRGLMASLKNGEIPTDSQNTNT